MITFKTILLFSLPIIAGQIGHMLFSVGDTILVGHYSTEALSALGIATAILSPFLIIGLGVSYVISPMKAQVIAEKGDVTAFVRTSLRVTSILGGVLGSAVVVVALLVHRFGFSSEVSSMVRSYLLITSVSLIPALWFQALKENLQAYERTVFTNGVILFFNIVNVVLNYFLIFTFNLGIIGAALATTFSRFGMMLTLAYHGKKYLHYNGSVSIPLLKAIFRKGFPVGLSAVVTASVFSMVTILAGTFSVIASAANNIILTLSAITYMIPYAIAGAVSVKVGQSIGHKRYDDVRRFSLAGISLGLIFATITALLFFIIPHLILSYASSDEEVLTYGIPLLFAVALYQIPDSIQTVLLGVLRGMGITLSPFILSIVGVWVVGFPIGVALAYWNGLEVQGLWIGLAVGLTVNALLLSTLFWYYSKEQRLRDAHNRTLQHQ